MNKISQLIAHFREANRRRIKNRPSRNLRGPLGKEASRVGNELDKVLSKVIGIPVVIVSYNNFSYVMQMVRQLNNFSIIPIVLDNASTDPMAQRGLKALPPSQAFVIFSAYNFKHTVGFIEPIYEKLPNIFAYSDPDLQFLETLPADFLNQLAKLTEEFDVYKAACALPLNFENFTLSSKRNSVHLKEPFEFQATHSILEWETKFWKQRLAHSLEVYSAQTDTTFAVYNKSKYRGFFFDAVRVAGSFSAIHLPWYEELDLMSTHEKNAYMDANQSTTWK